MQLKLQFWCIYLDIFVYQFMTVSPLQTCCRGFHEVYFLEEVVLKKSSDLFVDHNPTFVCWKIVKTSFAGADVSYDAGGESEESPGDNETIFETETQWHKK